MSFESEVHQLFEESGIHGLEAFGSALDLEWVTAALKDAGVASVRRRKLPAESVVWLMIGMGLFRDHSISQVVSHLDLVLPSADGSSRKVVNGAIPAARQRVGEAPLRKLFDRSAQEWSHDHAARDAWRGLKIYAMDGTTLSVPDTEENRSHFKLPETGRGQSGYPKLRLVTLMAARSHLLVNAAMGAFHGKNTAEPMLAKSLWNKVPNDSLLIADRWSTTIISPRQRQLQLPDRFL